MRKVLLILLVFSLKLSAQSLLKSGVLTPPVPYQERHFIAADDDGLILMLVSSSRTTPSKKNKIIKTKNPAGKCLFYYMCSYNSQLELNYILEIPVPFNELPRLKKKKHKTSYFNREMFTYSEGYLNMTILLKKELKFCRINIESKEVSYLEKNLDRTSIFTSTYGSSSGSGSEILMYPPKSLIILCAPLIYPLFLLKGKEFFYATNYNSISEIELVQERKREFSDVLISKNNSGRYTIASILKKKGFKNSLQIHRYNDTGTLTSNITLTPENERRILTADFEEINENTFVVSGFYNNARLYKVQDRNKFFYNGIYFARFTNNRLDFVRYHEFVDLPMYEQLLYNSKKISKKVNKSRSKGKDVTVGTTEIYMPHGIKQVANNKFAVSLEKVIANTVSSTDRITGAVSTKIVSYNFKSYYFLLFNDEGMLIHTKPHALDYNFKPLVLGFHSFYYFQNNEMYVMLINKHNFDNFVLNEKGMDAVSGINLREASNDINTGENILGYFNGYNVGGGNVFLTYFKIAHNLGSTNSKKVDREDIYYSLYKFKWLLRIYTKYFF